MDALKTALELCAEHRLSYEMLADKAGLDFKRVLAILEGRWTPSPAERDRVAGVFGLKRDDIAWGHKTQVSHLYGHGPQFGRTP
jgi:hypothetical protein